MLDANVTAKNSSARVKELGFLCLFILGYEIYLTLFLVALAFIPMSNEWRSLPPFQGLLLSFVIQFLVYLIVTAGVWAAYGTLRLRLGVGGLLDDTPLKAHQVRNEIKNGLVTCAIYAIYTYACLKISVGIWPETLTVGVLQVAAFLFLYDLWFYVSHRLLHTRPFRAVHGAHHRSVRVTPWSVHSLHPLEATINQLPFVVFALLWPVGFGMIVLLQVVLMFMTASGHSNYDPFAQIDGLPSAKSFWRFHQRHHHAGRGNYGFMGLHWDIVFKTVQRPAAHSS